MQPTALTPFKSRPAPAIALFFVAPLIAEFLLGNLPIKLLPALIVLAPMYGGGALFIREIVRRTGRGWPSIFLLALAYGILEEAFTTQSLFNPNYLNMNMHLLDPAYIPAFKLGGWWTIFVLNLHTVWSISTSIALVEATVPSHAETPWLGRIGLTITTILFAIGIAGSTFFTLKTPPRYFASTAQFACAALAIVILVVVAFRITKPTAVTSQPVPNPWLVGSLGLITGSAILITPNHWGWGAALAILAVDLVVLAAVITWSRSTAWTLLHKLALAAGAALAYAWHSFIEKPVVGSASLSSVRIGNIIFTVGAIALIAFAAKRTAAFTRATQLTTQ